MFVPFKLDFDNAKKFEKYSNICLYIFSIILIVIFFQKNKNIINIYYICSSIFVILYYIFLFIEKYIIFNANITRRVDFIDNSFNTMLGENRSQKYFSNDNLKGGLYKASVNSFESLFFTFNISKKMIFGLIIKLLILSVLVLLFLILQSNNIDIIFFIIHLSLPIIILSDFIIHLFFISNLSKLYESYRVIFSNLNNGISIESKIPEMLNNIIGYESLISWGNILLSTSIYNKENKKLSKKWENIKEKYNIKINFHL